MTITTPSEQTLIRTHNYRPGKYLSVIPRTALADDVIDTVEIDSDLGSIYGLSVVSGIASNNLFVGATLDIGTTAGAADIGRVRVRGVPSFGVLPINLTAPGWFLTPPAPGHFITIRDEYRPWQIDYRLLSTYDGGGVITGINQYLDFDKVFGSPHFGGIPKANITAGKNKDGTPKLICPPGWEDAPGAGRKVHFSTMWARAMTPGKTLTDFFWYFADGDVGTSTSLEVDVIFPPGFRHIYLLATDEDGYDHQMMFPIWCHSDDYLPLMNLEISNDETDVESGREMTFDFFGNPGVENTALLRQGATSCYWKVPYFGGSATPESYRTHCLGWITEETPLLRAVDQHYSVKLGGIAWWMDHFDGSTQALRDTHATPTGWFEWPHIDKTRAVWFGYAYFSTISNITNIFFTNEVPHTSDSLNVPPDTLWDQHKTVLNEFKMCTAGCDSFGNIFVERLYNFRNAGERMVIAPLLDLFATDISDQGLALTIRLAPNYAQDEGEGSYNQVSDGKLVLYKSLAPGKTKGAGTNSGKLPGQRLPSDIPQQTINEMTGRKLAADNNDLPSVPAELMSAWDVVEPAWQRPIRVTWTEETIHGVKLTQALFMVTKVSIVHSNAGGDSSVAPPPAEVISWELSRCTLGADGQTIPVPIQDDGVIQTADVPCDEMTPAWGTTSLACKITFTNESTGDYVAVLWDFGDDEFSYDNQPTHIYAAPGVYTVTLWIVDACGVVVSETNDIEVFEEEATADFTDSITPGSLTVDFEDTSTAETEIVAHAWDYGDDINNEGATQPDATPSHTYDAPGTYTVAHGVVTECGTLATVQHDVLVEAAEHCREEDFTGMSHSANWGPVRAEFDPGVGFANGIFDTLEINLQSGGNIELVNVIVNYTTSYTGSFTQQVTFTSYHNFPNVIETHAQNDPGFGGPGDHAAGQNFGTDPTVNYMIIKIGLTTTPPGDWLVVVTGVQVIYKAASEILGADNC